MCRESTFKMSDQALRSRLIRLAHRKPELRPVLLPMLANGTRTAADHGVSVRYHIENGLLGIVEVIALDLSKEFSESIRFRVPSISSRMQASVEGAIEWLPDPSQKGYILISFRLDQFDLHKAEIFLSMDLPSGKSFQKSFNAGSDWLARPARTNGVNFARALKGWIDSFFMSA
jgi:hypothetical protein